ncbi:MAG: glutamine--fructose-6-phosphate transaminase (isomerizing) [Rhodobacteraceae bacterium]|nr:glutamine--fructose-6-phosphate transaminase (isomerizing) [Paracoccaceae bacterium]
MCGIVGMLGQNEVAPILLESLRRLEYRGYDSAGIATLRDGKLQRRRAVGKLSELSDLLVRNPIQGLSGIGHTRWATHGPATLENSHPHQSRSVAVVHNGIVENHLELRAQLSALQIEHKTETDTESITLLCQYHLEQGLAHAEAALKTVRSLRGAFALAFLFEGEEDCLIVARQGSPLVIGHGQSETYVTSDSIALTGLTDRITYLQDGDFACLSRRKISIFNCGGEEVSRPLERRNIDSASTDKGGHKHFMSKEIYEQPKILAAAIERYETSGGMAELRPAVEMVSSCRRLELVGCGTAHFACQVAGYWFEWLAGIPVSTTVASEFSCRKQAFDEQTLGIFVSQSGETADTLSALRHMKNAGCGTLSLLNVTSSTMARESDVSLPIHAGVEIGVASTKAFTCQLLALANLVLAVAERRRYADQDRISRLRKEFRRLPALTSAALAADDGIKSIAGELGKFVSVLFIGRGAMYPLALEGALKLKEISYIHAEGLASGELKHGTLALVDDKMPVVVLAPQDQLYAKSLSSSEEVKARRGKIILVSDTTGPTGIWRTVPLPSVDPVFAPILYAIPMQLLAYHTAVHLGTDVDQPRNLAKSVTVE